MKGLSEVKEKQLNAVLLMIDGNNESDTDSEKKNAPIKFLLSLLAMSVTSAIPLNFKMKAHFTLHLTREIKVFYSKVLANRISAFELAALDLSNISRLPGYTLCW